MRVCGVCGQVATLFYRDEASLTFACRAHADASISKWAHIDALGGAVLKTQQRFARLHAATPAARTKRAGTA